MIAPHNVAGDFEVIIENLRADSLTPLLAQKLSRSANKPSAWAR